METRLSSSIKTVVFRGLLVLGAVVWVAMGPVPRADARTFTLQEAVRDAVTSSDAMAASQAKSDGASAKVDEASMALGPRLTLSAGYARLDTAPYVEQQLDIAAMMPEEMLSNPFLAPTIQDMEPQTLHLQMGLQNNIQVQLQAEQVLFAGTALYRQRAMALAQLRSAQEEERSTRHDVIYKTEQLFWQLALARKGHDVTVEAIETAQTHVSLLEAYVKTGLATEADLMSARVKLASLRLTELQTRQSAELAENAFRTLVHVPTGEEVVLDIEQGLLPMDPEVDTTKLVDQARENRPEMRMLQQQMISTRQAAGASWSSWLPAVALQGDVYLKNPDRAIEPNFYWSGDITVGLKWNLWDRGAALQHNRQAQAGMRQIEAMQRQLRDGIKLEIDQAIATFRQAQEQVKVSQEAVALSEQNLHLQELSFSNGVARNVDVLEAQTTLSKSRLDELQAETNLRIAEAGLRRAIGVDDERLAP